MRITRISHRRKYITAVYVDGREEPYLFDTTVVKQQGITEKTDISENEILRLSRLSQMNKAKERALRLLEFRSHSVKELKDKLKREYDEESTEYALEEMSRLGITDDLDFARNKTRFFSEIKHYSPARIKRELKIKGICDSFIETALSEYQTDPADQIEIIINTRFSPIPQDEKGKRRMINYLLRQGYSFSDIKRVIGEYTD